MESSTGLQVECRKATHLYFKESRGGFSGKIQRCTEHRGILNYVTGVRRASSVFFLSLNFFSEGFFDAMSQFYDSASIHFFGFDTIYWIFLALPLALRAI